MIKILLIAYYYPPLSTAATYRALNMVKYFKEDGFYVDVLSVDNIDYHSHDHHLISESKADNIFRAPSYEPLALSRKIRKNKIGTSKKAIVLSETKKKIINSFFPIDNKILWFIPAYNMGLKLIQHNHYDMIVATIGPYTSALIAYYLSKRSNIPYIIDYRDHWTLNTYHFHYNYLNTLLSKYLEKKIIQHSSFITCVSEYMSKELQHFYKEKNNKSILVSYNGFNEDDFANEVILRDKDQEEYCYIRYFGTFNANRKVDYFIQAVRELIAENYQFNKIKIEFYGVFTNDQIKLFSDPSLTNIVSVFNSIRHKEAIKLMCDSDVLLLFISTDDGQGVLTSKIFEYLKTQKMILPMIRQDGEANDILKKIGYDKTCPMEDIPCIKEYLREINERRFNNYPLKPELINNFSRKKQVSTISNEIRKILKNNKKT